MDDLFGHACRSIGVAEEHRSAVGLGDLIDGATHVDVDDFRAVRFGPGCRFEEPVHVVAVNLHAERLVDRVESLDIAGLFAVVSDAA